MQCGHRQWYSAWHTRQSDRVTRCAAEEKIYERLNFFRMKWVRTRKLLETMNAPDLRPKFMLLKDKFFLNGTFSPFKFCEFSSSVWKRVEFARIAARRFAICNVNFTPKCLGQFQFKCLCSSVHLAHKCSNRISTALQLACSNCFFREERL